MRDKYIDKFIRIALADIRAMWKHTDQCPNLKHLDTTWKRLITGLEHGLNVTTYQIITTRVVDERDEDNVLWVNIPKSLAFRLIPALENVSSYAEIDYVKPDGGVDGFVFSLDALEEVQKMVDANIAAPPVVFDEDTIVITYTCHKCSNNFSDTYSCVCDGECPECGAKHVAPLEWKSCGINKSNNKDTQA